MADLPLRATISSYRRPSSDDLESRIKAIEDHLSVVGADATTKGSDSRYFYNDMIVVYDATDTIPADPPVNNILAYDTVGSQAYIAVDGSWVAI